MCNSHVSSAADDRATRGDAAGPPAARLLSLAAAPTFAAMALWSAVAGGSAEMMCGSGGGVWSLTGMAAMYALMSVFHILPWLTLRSNRGNGNAAHSLARSSSPRRGKPASNKVVEA